MMLVTRSYRTYITVFSVFSKELIRETRCCRYESCIEIHGIGAFLLPSIKTSYLELIKYWKSFCKMVNTQNKSIKVELFQQHKFYVGQNAPLNFSCLPTLNYSWCSCFLLRTRFHSRTAKTVTGDIKNEDKLLNNCTYWPLATQITGKLSKTRCCSNKFNS